MARPTTVFIDADRLLAGIVTQYDAALADTDSRIASHRGGEHAWQQAHRDRHDLTTYGLKIDFDRFYGERLTKTEAQKCAKAMHEFEAAGYVKVLGQKATWIRATDAGRQQVAKQTTTSTEAAS